jgi:hypothetical protein
MLTHLVAKAIHNPPLSDRYLTAARLFWSEYQRLAGDAAASEEDTAAELGVLMLCRVDGKSKLEYLTDHSRALIRELARDVIHARERNLAALLDAIEHQTKSAAPSQGTRP